MKQTGLWATFASCYHQILSAWLQGQVYRDLTEAPGAFASSSPTRPGRQLGLYLRVRAVCELGRLHTEVNMSSYLPEKPWVVIPPSGLPLLVCMGMRGGTQDRLRQPVTSNRQALLETSEQILAWEKPESQDDWHQGPFKPQQQAVLALYKSHIRPYCSNSVQECLKWQYLKDKYSSASLQTIFIHFPQKRSEQHRDTFGSQSIKSQELKAVGTLVQGQTQTGYLCSMPTLADGINKLQNRQP